MKNEKKIPPLPEEVLEQLVINDAVSACECTGLFPTPPRNADEIESYEEIYNYLPPSPEKKE